MAASSGEPDSPSTSLLHESEPTTLRSVSNTTEAFHFWFYFSLIASLVALFCVLLCAPSPQDPKTWSLNVPAVLRAHYSDGRTIKVQTAPNHPEVGVFSVQQGPANSGNHVLIIHGMGCSSFSFRGIVKFLGQMNVRAVAIDLPGSGFSDKSTVVIEEKSSPLGRLWEVFEDIREKGLFWGFDQLVEQGYMNVEEKKVPTLKRVSSIRPIELDGEAMGRVLGQVVDSMGLAPVDLVLHDSALSLSANWITENHGLIRSLVLLDSAPNVTALPLWPFQIPVVKEIVLGVGFVFQRFLAVCCVRSVSKVEAEAHRVLLKGRDWGGAVFGMGKIEF